ncbi:MAG: PfkB family carbohydrate kinase, partial [Gordonia sp. (in: high G+C Gram-positive bacteria)]
TLVDGLRAAGVGVDGIRSVPGPTGTALIVVDAAGENQIAVCPGANARLRADDVTPAADEAVLCQLEVDIALVVAAARRARGFFALNAAPAHELPAELRDRADLIVVNESEYAALPELRTARAVAITYGGDGAELRRHGSQVAVATAPRVSVVNSVGAGDAFCAALVLALLTGYDDARSLRLACAVGAAAVQAPQSQPPLDPLASYLGEAPPADATGPGPRCAGDR